MTTPRADFQFTTGQVTKAAGITGAALQTWIRRRVIEVQGESGVDMPGKPGVRRSFSFFNVIEIATAAALIKAGVELADAFQAAQQYAYVGGSGRMPGAPFPAPSGTFLAVAGNLSAVIRRRPREDIYSAAWSHLGHPEALTLLNANAVFDRVVAALGLEPAAIRLAADAEAPDQSGFHGDEDLGQPPSRPLSATREV